MSLHSEVGIMIHHKFTCVKPLLVVKETENMMMAEIFEITTDGFPVVENNTNGNFKLPNQRFWVPGLIEPVQSFPHALIFQHF